MSVATDDLIQLTHAWPRGCRAVPDASAWRPNGGDLHIELKR
jgi:hypothetical protein